MKSPKWRRRYEPPGEGPDAKHRDRRKGECLQPPTRHPCAIFRRSGGGGMSHPARGSLQRGGGAPSVDGDPTAKAIIGAAIPCASGRGSHPHCVWPLLRRALRPMRSMGIDGQANRGARPTRNRGALALWPSEAEGVSNAGAVFARVGNTRMRDTAGNEGSQGTTPVARRAGSNEKTSAGGGGPGNVPGARFRRGESTG